MCSKSISGVIDTTSSVTPDMAARGGQDRLLRGGDVARRRRYRAHGMPGLDYLPIRFLPRLEREGGEELACRIMVDNPARWLDRPPSS
jgi:phosphotriesterase-related protein